jgi:hypothetical protein
MSPALSGKAKLDAFSLGEQPRAREMIGMDVGVKHAYEAPSALLKQPNVYVGFD